MKKIKALKIIRNKTVFTLAALLCLFLALSFMYSLVYASENEQPITLEAENGKLSAGASINGGKVVNLGKSGTNTEGKVSFHNLDIPSDAEYIIKIYYMSGSDDRYFNITTDYGKYKLDCPSTGSFDKVGSIDIKLDLKKGGSVTFGSEWYAPDLDKIEIYNTEQTYIPNKEYSNTNSIEIGGEKVFVTIDTNNGVYSIIRDDKVIIKNAHAEIVVDNILVSSDDFANHELEENKSENSFTFTHTEHPAFNGIMTQTFYLKGDYVLTEVKVTGNGSDIISSNNISALVSYNRSVNIENGIFIKIPFDNDMWTEPSFIGVNDLGKPTRSYEAMAYYNVDTLESLVVGSVTHDIWKSAIDIYGVRGEVAGLRVFGGVSDENTRDNSPHGYITANTISSPLIFIGVYDDFRDGLNAYAKANTDIAPAKESVKDVPFGYNSWGSLQSAVKYSDMIKISDFVKEYLQDIWTEDGAPVYINIDSFWDFIVANDKDCSYSLDIALRAFANHCKKNGQKAGIYYTPFACWHGDENALKNSRMEGSDYTYYDAAIKKSDGSGLYGKLDGGYALDPTHPGTLARIDYMMKYFINLGFEYIKLDFMAHGAVEGKHYDQSITTGIQAYNLGMKRINDICEGKMIVNLSIAPLFPYQYADGRRISCDAFSSLDNTMHVLSHLTACFWEENIYPYPDPDHLVVTGVSEGVARCRVTAGAICGTSFIIGDDLTKIKPDTSSFKRIMKMYGNKDVISVAKLGRAFTPYEVSAGDRCADIYWTTVDDTVYIAMFNFNNLKSQKTVDLSEIVKAIPEHATAKELWSGKEITFSKNTLTYTLSAKDAALIRIGTNDIEENPEAPLPPEATVTTSKTEEETPSAPTTSAPITESLPSSTDNNTPTESNTRKTGAVLSLVLGVCAITAAVVSVIVIFRKKK